MKRIASLRGLVRSTSKKFLQVLPVDPQEGQNGHSQSSGNKLRHKKDSNNKSLKKGRRNRGEDPEPTNSHDRWEKKRDKKRDNHRRSSKSSSHKSQREDPDDQVNARDDRRRRRRARSPPEECDGRYERELVRRESCKQLSGLLLSRKSDFIASDSDSDHEEEENSIHLQSLDDNSIMSGEASSIDVSTASKSRNSPSRREQPKDLNDSLMSSMESMRFQPPSINSGFCKPEPMASSGDTEMEQAMKEKEELARMIAQLEAETKTIEDQFKDTQRTNEIVRAQSQLHLCDEEDTTNPPVENSPDYKHFMKPSVAQTIMSPDGAPITKKRLPEISNWDKILDNADGNVNMLINELQSEIGMGTNASNILGAMTRSSSRSGSASDSGSETGSYDTSTAESFAYESGYSSGTFGSEMEQSPSMLDLQDEILYMLHKNPNSAVHEPTPQPEPPEQLFSSSQQPMMMMNSMHDEEDNESFEYNPRDESVMPQRKPDPVDSSTIVPPALKRTSSLRSFNTSQDECPSDRRAILPPQDMQTAGIAPKLKKIPSLRSLHTQQNGSPHVITDEVSGLPMRMKKTPSLRSLHTLQNQSIGEAGDSASQAEESYYSKGMQMKKTPSLRSLHTLQNQSIGEAGDSASQAEGSYYSKGMQMKKTPSLRSLHTLQDTPGDMSRAARSSYREATKNVVSHGGPHAQLPDPFKEVSVGKLRRIQLFQQSMQSSSMRQDEPLPCSHENTRQAVIHRHRHLNHESDVESDSESREPSEEFMAMLQSCSDIDASLHQDLDLDQSASISHGDLVAHRQLSRKPCEQENDVDDESEKDASDWLLQQMSLPSSSILPIQRRQPPDDASESTGTWTFYTIKTSKTSASNSTPVNPSDFLPQWDAAPFCNSGHKMQTFQTNLAAVGARTQRHDPPDEKSTELPKCISPEKNHSRRETTREPFNISRQLPRQQRKRCDPPETGRLAPSIRDSEVSETANQDSTSKNNRITVSERKETAPVSAHGKFSREIQDVALRTPKSHSKSSYRSGNEETSNLGHRLRQLPSLPKQTYKTMNKEIHADNKAIESDEMESRHSNRITPRMISFHRPSEDSDTMSEITGVEKHDIVKETNVVDWKAAERVLATVFSSQQLQLSSQQLQADDLPSPGGSPESAMQVLSLHISATPTNIRALKKTLSNPTPLSELSSESSNDESIQLIPNSPEVCRLQDAKRQEQPIHSSGIRMEHNSILEKKRNERRGSSKSLRPIQLPDKQDATTETSAPRLRKHRKIPDIEELLKRGSTSKDKREMKPRQKSALPCVANEKRTVEIDAKAKEKKNKSEHRSRQAKKLQKKEKAVREALIEAHPTKNISKAPQQQNKSNCGKEEEDLWKSWSQVRRVSDEQLHGAVARERPQSSSTGTMKSSESKVEKPAKKKKKSKTSKDEKTKKTEDRLSATRASSSTESLIAQLEKEKARKKAKAKLLRDATSGTNKEKKGRSKDTSKSLSEKKKSKKKKHSAYETPVSEHTAETMPVSSLDSQGTWREKSKRLQKASARSVYFEMSRRKTYSELVAT